MLKAALSRRERQIMEIVYRRGEVTAAEILADLPDPPSYSAVRGLLRILVDKQHLRHREDGPRYVYSPVVTREKARTKAIADLLDTFFDGSAAEAAAALLGSSRRKLSKEELDELDALIAEARSRGQ
jgi:BlaI family transcriptional regulator, penicillinase repressor